MLGLLQLLAAGYLLFLLSLIVHAAWLLTHPHRKTFAWAVARGRPGDPSQLPGAGRAYSTWSFRSGGLSFEVWDIRGDDPSGPVVILSHGWSDSRLGGLLRAPFLLPLASRLILWDMRGHGEAPGRCTLGTKEVDDLLALIDATGARPVVLYGWSLGAGVGIAAAARSPAVAGVIAEAPYRHAITPARNVMRALAYPHRLNLAPALWVLGWCFGVGPRWRGFDRAALAAMVRAPLLVLQGSKDSVCPVEEARRITEAAPKGRLVVVDGAGHNNLWIEEPFAARCAAEVAAFLRDAGLAAPARVPSR